VRLADLLRLGQRRLEQRQLGGAVQREVALAEIRPHRSEQLPRTAAIERRAVGDRPHRSVQPQPIAAHAGCPCAGEGSIGLDMLPHGRERRCVHELEHRARRRWQLVAGLVHDGERGVGASTGELDLGLRELDDHGRRGRSAAIGDVQRQRLAHQALGPVEIAGTTPHLGKGDGDPAVPWVGRG